MNVEMPLSWLSPAPTRQRIESKIGMRADAQGTKLPVCAMSAITPTWRIYVLFPPMFGPAAGAVSDRRGMIVNGCTH